MRRLLGQLLDLLGIVIHHLRSKGDLIPMLSAKSWSSGVWNTVTDHGDDLTDAQLADVLTLNLQHGIFIGGLQQPNQMAPPGWFYRSRFAR